MGTCCLEYVVLRHFDSPLSHGRTWNPCCTYYIIHQITKPLHLIQSDLVIEDHNATKIGHVKMDWHVWKRRYDLFLGSTHEIGRVDGEFLAWEFNVMGPNGALLHQLPIDFRLFNS